MTKQKDPSQLNKVGRRPWRVFSDEEVGRMASMWKEGRSQTFIAKEFNTAQCVVSRVLRAAGIESKPGRFWSKRGAESNLWKTGRMVTEDGYVLVHVPHGDPFAHMRNRMSYVLEHRLVVARSIGRPLLKNEVVHHLNGIRDDNRIENLELRQTKDPKGVRLSQGSHCPTCRCGEAIIGGL